MAYVDPHFRRMPRPGGGRHGRQVTRRDKLLAIAFGALLIFGLWWMLFRPEPYTVSSLDFDGVFYFTGSVTEDTHQEFYGRFGNSEVVVIVGLGGKYEATTNRANVLLAQMLLSDESPEPTSKRFSNAVVVCEFSEDCKNIVREVSANARERQSQWTSSNN
jgi:hypothetical protein